jgi:wobble nucleotide-excising tRNase
MPKLAEALIERASIQKELDLLRININQNVQVEDGEVPEESVKDLMKTFRELLDRQAGLIAQINRTNSQIEANEGVYVGLTIMQLIAKRDSIAQLKNQYQSLSQQTVRSYGRTRDDIKMVLTFSPKEMRKEVDKLSKEHREIDTLIQGLNWTTELV